jgi:hypothetical protein
MLLEMRDYKAVMLLDDSTVQFDASNQEMNEQTRWQTLKNNWRLIRAVATSATQHEKSPIEEILRPPLDIPSISSGAIVTSTGVSFPFVRIGALTIRMTDCSIPSDQIRVLCLAICLSGTIRTTQNITQFTSNGHDVFSAPRWGNWKSLYRQLLAQGRVWDFHDLCIAAIDSDGVVSMLEAFFGDRGLEGLNRLLHDWTTPTMGLDETTQLALMDIISVAVLNMDMPRDSALIGACLGLAQPIADNLMATSPKSMRSRPFFHWALAKAAVSARRGLSSGPSTDPFLKHPDRWGGLKVKYSTFGSRLIRLFYYVPIGEENPGLHSFNVPPSRQEPLRTILGASREMEDHHIESLCLAELILQSSERHSYFEQLTNLQKSTHDMTGYLFTCLSRYLICKDDQDRTQLRDDLAEVGWWEDMLHNLTFPNQVAARDIIRKALSTRHQGDNSMSAGIKYIGVLSKGFREIIVKHTFRDTGVWQSAAAPAPSTDQESDSSADEWIRSQERRIYGGRRGRINRHGKRIT